MTESRYDGPWPLDPHRVRPLRRRVLRPDQPPDASSYPRDDDPLALHVGIFADGKVVAAGSLFPEDGWRIRGMATLPEHRGRGLGRAVLEALLDGAAERGGGRVWCNARTSVQSFYERQGFRGEGEVFELEPLGPHRRMAREVESAVAEGGSRLDRARALLERPPTPPDRRTGEPSRPR